MAKTISPKIDTVPLPESVVRVKLPAKIAYDLKSVQKVQASILDRLGCGACCSGYHILFDVIRTFKVDHDLDVQEIAEFDVLGR
jgi:hypothetical protein